VEYIISVYDLFAKKIMLQLNYFIDSSNIHMSSGIINSRVVSCERVELREVIFNDEGHQAQKEANLWWASGETKRNQMKGVWFVRRGVNEFKMEDSKSSMVVGSCNPRCISRH
jgi:hypothetical protein